MDKRVTLPLIDPLYSTFHHQGPATATITKNPTIRNWYLNESMNLVCTRKFLNGYTTPEITIWASSYGDCPFFERISVTSQFSQGYINKIIRKMIDDGYYVYFDKIDDYYVEGKSWYKKRHFNHNGLICGYDQNNKSYCIYAYDRNWIYRKFWASQHSFNNARIAVEKQGVYPCFIAMRPKNDIINFSPKTVYSKLMDYLNSDLEKYPYQGDGIVLGIVVHEYIAEYVSKLYCGEIPYERMDRRVFRLIWEHKKVMLERIKLIENSLNLDNTVSEKYVSLVKNADMMRMLYASHHMKRRDEVLPIIQKMLLELMQDERELLNRLVMMMEATFEN